MIILSCLILSIIYLIVKLILYIVVWKFGKFTYEGFSAAGFAYNSDKNIFYSTKNAWQKKFGYCHLYDVGAPLFRMIIDTEPIRFFYDNRSWLLTFWKGQYGIVTGAEIGIYVSDEQKATKRTLYFPVNDDEMLDMSFVLFKKGNVITRVSARHWWLAIFKIGMFSRPKDLTMDIKITFKNKEMLNAFLKSFKKLGYKEKDYQVIDNTFCFVFKKPKTHKVWTRFFLIDYIRQYFNHKNVDLYNKFLSDVIDENKDNDDKKHIKIEKMIPNILKNSPYYEEIPNHEIKTKKTSINNVIFLNDSVYSNIKKDNNE